EFMRDQQFSWERLNEGFLAWRKVYPLSRSTLNHYARLAAMYRQRDTARGLFEQIHDEFYIANVWPSEKYFKNFKSWATGETEFPEQKPLNLAVKDRDLERVKRLLKEGAEADAEDIYGYTPLLRSISDGNEELVKLLLDSGADVNAAFDDGRTA